MRVSPTFGGAARHGCVLLLCFSLVRVLRYLGNALRLRRGFRVALRFKSKRASRAARFRRDALLLLSESNAGLGRHGFAAALAGCVAALRCMSCASLANESMPLFECLYWPPIVEHSRKPRE